MLAECEELARLMASSRDSAAVGLAMWHQAYLLFKVQLPELACPPDLLERSKAAHREEALRRRLPTRLKRVLKQAVESAARGQQVEMDYLVEGPGGEGCLVVDVALPARRIALEAGGPHHFLRNVPQQLRGEREARKGLLRAWGWEVVSVPYTAHDDASGSGSGSQDEAVGRIESYLRQHTALEELLGSGGRAGRMNAETLE